jgi:hypothetical protein
VSEREEKEKTHSLFDPQTSLKSSYKILFSVPSSFQLHSLSHSQTLYSNEKTHTHREKEGNGEEGDEEKGKDEEEEKK